MFEREEEVTIQESSKEVKESNEEVTGVGMAKKIIEAFKIEGEQK